MNRLSLIKLLKNLNILAFILNVVQAFVSLVFLDDPKQTFLSSLVALVCLKAVNDATKYIQEMESNDNKNI